MITRQRQREDLLAVLQLLRGDHLIQRRRIRAESDVKLREPKRRVQQEQNRHDDRGQKHTEPGRRLLVLLHAREFISR